MQKYTCRGVYIHIIYAIYYIYIIYIYTHMYIYTCTGNYTAYLGTLEKSSRDLQRGAGITLGVWDGHWALTRDNGTCAGGISGACMDNVLKITTPI